MATSSLNTIVQKYYWGKSSSYWEQGVAWLDFDLPEVWRRQVNVCGIAYGRNEPVKEAQVCKNVIDYVRASLGINRFSDAAMKGGTANVGKNPFKHFMWAMFEEMVIERALIERNAENTACGEATCDKEEPEL